MRRLPICRGEVAATRRGVWAARQPLMIFWVKFASRKSCKSGRFDEARSHESGCRSCVDLHPRCLRLQKQEEQSWTEGHRQNQQLLANQQLRTSTTTPLIVFLLQPLLQQPLLLQQQLLLLLLWRLLLLPPPSLLLLLVWWLLEATSTISHSVDSCVFLASSSIHTLLLSIPLF